jgi:hypothetical protein
VSDQTEMINSVLGDFTPIGEEHPVAQETMESVREMLEARGTELQELSTIEASVDVGVIRPGDTVIFSTRELLPADMVETLKAQISESLPGITPVILSGLRVEAVYRQEDDDA